MKTILHLVTHDKFTVGYINFMKKYLADYNHFFLISTFCHSKVPIDGRLINDDNVVRFSNYKELAFSRRIRLLLDQSDKIIVSGLFGFERSIFFWPRRLFNKMFFQYWGGDFYQYRERSSIFDIHFLLKILLKFCMRRTEGAIFLLDEEHSKYKEITGIIPKKEFTAAVPFDPDTLFPFKEYRDSVNSSTKRIVVGNSATPSNCHEEVFLSLAHFSDEDIEIFCPLSYGERDYGDFVSNLGTKLFGEKFHPIFNLLPEDEYYRFLASCDVGVYGNNRQQGGGNIFALLRMGRKIYMKSDNSLCNFLRNRGCIVYDVLDISKISLQEFLFISNEAKEYNWNMADNWNDLGTMIKQWTDVFECRLC